MLPASGKHSSQANFLPGHHVPDFEGGIDLRSNAVADLPRVGIDGFLEGFPSDIVWFLSEALKFGNVSSSSLIRFETQ